MSDSNKIKFFLIFGLILIIIVGVIIYFALSVDTDGTGQRRGLGIFLPFTGNNSDGFFGGQTPPPPGTIFGPEGELPESERQRLQQLSDEPVIGPYLREGENTVVYFKRGLGHIFTAPFNGSEEEKRIVQFTIPDVIDVNWAPNGSYAILTTFNDSLVKNFWVNFTSTSTIESGAFSDVLLSSTFSPNSRELASFIKRGADYIVRASTPKGTGARTLYQTPMPDYELAWISPQTLSLQTRGSVYAPSFLEILRSTGGTPTMISSGKLGFDVLWNPQGTRYLASETDSRGKIISLAVHNPQDKRLVEIGLPSLPEKCVFSKREPVVYCGFPRRFTNDPLPDAWWKGQVSFTDIVAKFNYETKSLEPVIPGGNFDITNPLLSADEEYLFFINKKDSTLWSYWMGTLPAGQAESATTDETDE